MAVSQARIIESLEQACFDINPDEFIFSFLDAYGFPKNTITRLRNGTGNRNIGNGADIGLKKKIYFRVVQAGQDVNTEVENLRNSAVVAQNDVRFVVATNFEGLAAFDLKAEERLETSVSELDKNYDFFLPLAGYEKAVMHSEHPADLKASEKMGQLFDLIRERNDLNKPEDIHALNVFLTRLLFCFYAEDTSIFDKGQMTYAIQSHTRDDGSDVDQFFNKLFAVLNLRDGTDERKRLPSYLQAFKYVNGGLFRANEPIPSFGRKARRILLDCGALDWSEINPDIFGSMFQAVIDEKQRSNLGQHYTSVSNIMKVIQPLFLDQLYEALEKSRDNEERLQALLVRLQNLRIFDPACGSGNFLIIAYKELRRLEMKIIDALNEIGKQDVMYLSGIRLTQFYGIEIDDFAHEIASLSLWLAEHQMNIEFKSKFGYAEAALPLREGGNIICGNSLRLDWEAVCPPSDENGKNYEVYICGNPPFLGRGGRNASQNKDMAFVFSSFKSHGILDLVACWFWKGAQYIANKNAQLALVATNSICQGEQVTTLWRPILQKKLTIRFAYQTFSWKNHAKQNAAVHVVVIGLTNAGDSKEKLLFKTMVNGTAHRVVLKNINPYLLEGKDTFISKSRKPICDVSEMVFGSMPNDGGQLLLNTKEKNDLIALEPGALKWTRRLLGAQEFLQAEERWCLWLTDATPKEIDAMPLVKQRVRNVRQIRLESERISTQRLASNPHLFGEIRQPKEGFYILVPRVSSERRVYVPIGFLSADVIANDANQIIPNGTLYEFGILASEMHNDWMRAIAGRLKSDYRYSVTLVYNTFPWPNVPEIKRKHIEQLAEKVLLIRENYPDKSLADLYDPGKMPQLLLAAHKALDRAVELLYRDKPFLDASERLEHLFVRYEKLVAGEKTNTTVKITERASNHG